MSAKELVLQKDEVEQEIQQLTAYLTAPGMPGLSGGLVDAEGYPLADVEKLIAVRQARHRLACLQNDHKALMAQIEQGLHALHASIKTRQPSTAPSSSSLPPPHATAASPPPPPHSAAQDEALQLKQPIALIDQVSDTSPAHTAGLRAGDVLLSFGSVEHAGPGGGSPSSWLAHIAQVVRDSQDREVVLWVRRGTQHLRLVLVPRSWAGRGLVGCHIAPLPHQA